MLWFRYSVLQWAAMLLHRPLDQGKCTRNNRNAALVMCIILSAQHYESAEHSQPSKIFALTFCKSTPQQSLLDMAGDDKTLTQ
jgi:hypothetical protein